jgi:putative flippase GtrA
VRFGALGAVTFVVNLGLLLLFKAAGIPSIPAYALALFLAVQFNFAISQFWVWGDRHVASFWGRAMAERWVTFHGCIAVSLVVNFVVFAAAQLVMPDLLAAVAGVGASTLVKFLSLDRLAFKDRITAPAADG